MGGLLLLGLAFTGAVGIAIVIPYFWPVLAIVLLVMALASLERKQK